MALHFTRQEFADRLTRLKAVMNQKNLDAMLLFAQESMFWLTGYDSFGFCFFQTMLVTRSGEFTLLTRAPDLRQAQHTSIVEEILIWKDQAGYDPTQDLLELLKAKLPRGSQIGLEYDTAGMTGKICRQLDQRLTDQYQLHDASEIVTRLRLVKSQAELDYTVTAARLADDALDAAIMKTKAGADEGEILAAMHSAIFSQGGDYAGNEFIIGSGPDALLCRYKSGRRKLSAQDQLTLEWAGAFAHYHAAMMATLIVGQPSPRHVQLFEAAAHALGSVEAAMQVGNPVGAMFDAHAKALDDAGLQEHRLNACGYSLGAVFTPCWMDQPMIYEANPLILEDNMVFFVHMIIADSDSQTAMTLGRTYTTGSQGPQRLSRHEIDLIQC